MRRCTRSAALAVAAVLVAASASAAPVPRWTGEANPAAWIGPDADRALDGPLGAVPHAEATAAPNPVQQRAASAAAIAAAAGQWPAADDSGTDLPPDGLAAGTMASASGSFPVATTGRGATGGFETTRFVYARPAAQPFMTSR